MATGIPLAERTITDVAPMIQRGELSPVALVDEVLDRAETLGPVLNSFITIDADGARAAARVAEKEIANGRYRGPLHGVPIAHKDVFETRGMRTTAHSRVLGDWLPESDANVVTRLEAAGAIMIGKTNTYEFACGATPVYGLPINPWSARHITGGSSAGSASAVAAGLCFAATGTCTAGSIRVPASFCGIVGLKPTYGRIGRGGLVPVSWSLDHAGPMTRSVMDTTLVLDVLSGPDPRDLGAVRHSLDAIAPILGWPDRPASTALDGVRLGVPRGFFDAPVQDGVVARVSEAYEHLRSIGAVLVDVDLSVADLTSTALRGIMWSEAHVVHRRWLQDDPTAYGGDTRRSVTIGASLSADEYLRAQRLRQRIRAGFDAALEGVDALVWPATMRSAFAVDEPQGWSGQQTRLSNITGTPSVTVPCGFDDLGLPIGLQVNGRAFDEATVLRVALAYEATAGYVSMRPTVERVAPPEPSVEFARAAAPPDFTAAERSRLEDDVRAAHERHGIRVLDEDIDVLVIELANFRRDLDRLDDVRAAMHVEPAVHQNPILG